MFLKAHTHTHVQTICSMIKCAKSKSSKFFRGSTTGPPPAFRDGKRKKKQGKRERERMRDGVGGMKKKREGAGERREWKIE